MAAHDKLSPDLHYVSSAFNGFVTFMNTAKPGETSWNDKRILYEVSCYTRRKDEKLKSKMEEVQGQVELIEG